MLVALVTVRLPVTAVAPAGTRADAQPRALTPATGKVRTVLVVNLPVRPMLV